MRLKPLTSIHCSRPTAATQNRRADVKVLAGIGIIGVLIVDRGGDPLRHL